MPRPLTVSVAALLLAAPPAAHAQAYGTTRYTGCGQYFCARLTWTVTDAGPDPVFPVHDATLDYVLTLTAQPRIAERDYYFGLNDIRIRFALPPGYESGWGRAGELAEPFVRDPLYPGQVFTFGPTGGPVTAPGRPGAPDGVDVGLFTADGPEYDQFYDSILLDLVVTPTPEPSTLALAGAGVVLLGAWWRRTA